MIQRRRLLQGLGASSLATLPLARAQTTAWPARPIKFIVAFAPAGPADIIGRLLAQPLGDALGQNIVVENRAGAGGSLGSGVVAKADPDGYTILINTSAYAVNPAMDRNQSFDAEKDLVLAALVASSPNLIVAAPKLPARTLKDAIAAARGGSYNYATAGAGTTPHLSAEYLFKVLGKVNVTHVPFKGAGPALSAVAGGQVELASVALPSAVELVKSGNVRGLAVTSARRVASMPDVPTVAESGFPGFEDLTWVGVFVPSKTPVAIVQRLNREVAAILRQPAFQARLATTGFEPMGGSLAEVQAFLQADLRKWAKVVKETGATAD
ncbi:MAG TPA: tripartite tricarboxylate transporter substrate binding protein [Ideonella sp.]|nr:tripartite tricarboxylate transporter substrate binding protein [Ideonella sp.]